MGMVGEEASLYDEWLAQQKVVKMAVATHGRDSEIAQSARETADAILATLNHQTPSRSERFRQQFRRR